MVESTASVEPACEAGRQSLAVRFVGSGSEYFRIWTVNLLLTIVTLAFYFPFAKARRLRYFHGATEIGGHPMSFHADPWKMLRGYLLVLLLFGLYNIAGQVSAAAALLTVGVIAAIAPMLWHSALRFRMANTGWRGLRMRYTGTRAQAYRLAALPIALIVLTVALVLALAAPRPSALKTDPADMVPAMLLIVLLPLALFPLLLALLKRQIHQHLAYGDEQSRFEPGIGAFYRLALRVLGVALLSLIALIAATVMLALLSGLDVMASGGMGVAWLVAASLIGAAAVLAGPAYLSARLQNLLWSNTHSGRLRLHSRLRARSLVALTLRNTALIVLTLGLYYPFAKVATARLRLEAVSIEVLGDIGTIGRGAPQADESAAGDAAGDLFGFDVGL
jgi:uncharacterized membrane protein YjgN (DUF898 family)